MFYKEYDTLTPFWTPLRKTKGVLTGMSRYPLAFIFAAVFGESLAAGAANPHLKSYERDFICKDCETQKFY